MTFISLFSLDVDLVRFKLKGNAQFVQKMTFEPFVVSKKAITGVGNIPKATIFKIFLSLSYKNTQLISLGIAFLYFLRKTLTDDFWGLHKNMNCAFPLTINVIF